MTSLEFIEKEIEKEKITIRVNTSLLSNFDNEDDVANNVLLTKIMIAENRLKNLKQIKSELEAWEVVQGTIVEGQDGDGRYCYIETMYFTGEKGEKVTKGLYNDETR